MQEVPQSLIGPGQDRYLTPSVGGGVGELAVNSVFAFKVGQTIIQHESVIQNTLRSSNNIMDYCQLLSDCYFLKLRVGVQHSACALFFCRKKIACLANTLHFCHYY